MSYLKVEIKLSNLDLDKGAFTDAMFETLNTQMRQAARAWLKAVLTRVPVFTGEARGSLKPLGQFLHVAVPIHPVAQRKSYTPEGGALQSKFEFIQNGPIYSFIFNEAVVHYLINEFYDPRPYGIHLTHEPIPWQSFQVGKIAFRNYLKTYLKEKMPKITKYMLRGTKYIKN